MSTAASPPKREREEAAAASSEEDYFTPDSSPAPFKKPKSPSSLNETSDHASPPDSSASPAALESNTTSGDVSESQSEQLERIFKNLRLRRIVKENHSSEINQLAFCLNQRHNRTPFGLDQVKVFEKRGAVKRDPMDNSNILGTTGGPQANIYDNEHCGDHLDIMSHFLLDPSGEEGAEELPAHPTKDEYLLSASKDGTVRMWNILTGKCLLIFEYKASVTCFIPSANGRVFLTGSYNGEVRKWNVPEFESEPEEPIVVLDELFFCAGTSNGSVYIYNIDSGKTVTELKHRRSTKAIRTCIFARDSRTVICAGEDSFIWRYDYVTDDTLNEWATWKPEL
ncbi:hypothetical protein BGZ80_010793 [Entomortierella chlamydospora]|uniref:Uncharacterized protein n=1 Tax=Entomortierella chlamydospora TaxID=101097 RepID=A0A9P6MVC4_9FUNG|nr:hypothetical protein BGZ80_010793 [Entomortierella chlamydospora]